jgi:hypothetical protein
MNGEALVTPARTSGAVSAVSAPFPILARASGLSQLDFIARVVEDAERLRVEGVHLMEDFVLSIHMTAAANVEVLVQQLFTSITVHVDVGELLGAYFTKEIARTISDDISCKQIL